MAEGSLTPGTVPRERSVSSPEERGGKVWAWVAFSALLHAMFIWSLFVVPHVPLRKAPPYPVYTVDLVGGEKIGGEALSPVAPPAPPAKQEAKKPKVEPSPRVPVTKEVKKKAVEKAAPVREEVALEKSKKEMKKEQKEQQVEQALPNQVREKLIEAALQRVKDRAESEQKKQKEQKEVRSSGSGEGEGAATAGSGGRGGGIVKGIEFIRYYNLMRSRIKESWTWVGRRSDLEVTVRFGIRENGEIVGLRILQASGDPSYDDSVVRAVRKASPLPGPPESYRRDFMDVELTFRPKDLGG